MNSHSDLGRDEAPRVARSPMERLLADARARLVETGTRNRLVHTPRGGKRTRSLPIIGGDADVLFGTLVRSSRGLRFLPVSLNSRWRFGKTAEIQSLSPTGQGSYCKLTSMRKCSKSVSFLFIGTRRPPRKSKASTSSFSQSDSCVGMRTKSRRSSRSAASSQFRFR